MIITLAACVLLLTGLPSGSDAINPATMESGLRVFNVRDFGATGLKADSAQTAIQKAVDACAAAGGGVVYFPPGRYSTGTLHLRSHVRVRVESGAVVYSIKYKAAFPKDALFYGEDLVDITLEGRGTIDGQGGYDYRLKGNHEDDFIYPNQVEMEKRGLPLTRSFPKTDQFGKLVLLLRCRDIRIEGLSFIDSPSWTMHLYGCERTVIEGVTIRSSLKDGVWADGIDPDGCKDLRISNCTIETGDDALVFYSMNWFGPALPCENITVTNCRLSSASSAIKFCDGNMNAVRNVTISNCVITNSNRGLAFMNFDGGVVENIIISGLTIDCVRYDWFWWGDGEPFHFNIRKRSEVHKNWKKEDDRPAGTIRNVILRDIIARGRGASICNGHPDSPLDGITMDNVKLFLAHDPSAPYDKAVNALTFKMARNLRLRNVEIIWDKPEFQAWRSALLVDDVEGLEIDGLRAGPAPVAGAKDAPVILLRDVRDAWIRNSRAVKGRAFGSPLTRGLKPRASTAEIPPGKPGALVAVEGTGVFFGIEGPRTDDIVIASSDSRKAKMIVRESKNVPPESVRIIHDPRTPEPDSTAARAAAEAPGFAVLMREAMRAGFARGSASAAKARPLTRKSD